MSRTCGRRKVSVGTLLLFVAMSVALVRPAQAQDAACVGTPVRPGDSIQALLTAKPTGTIFCFAPGIHRPTAPLKPKSYQQLIGEPGAVLEGNRTFDGFAGYGILNVRIKGFEIRNFKGGMQTGPAWIVENNDIHDNAMDGARLNHRTIFRNNHSHHNMRAGVFGYGEGILVEGNEIDHNQIQYSATDPNICSQKFVWTVNLVVRNNHYHHNRCPALWVDINGYNPIIENNLLTENYGEAIDCEISYGCIIRNNVVRDNGKGIYAASSRDVEIYGNTVTGNALHSIRITQQGTATGIRTDHPSSYGSHATVNNYVHDNVVVMKSGFVGVTKYGNVGDTVFSAAANNRFQNNKYYVANGGNWFQWASKNLLWTGWRAAGHDLTGSQTIGDVTTLPGDTDEPPVDDPDPPIDPDPDDDPDLPGDPCTVRGTAGRDKLVGTPQADVICGLGGRDVLIGRGGTDVLMGGEGLDEVSYRGAPNGVRVDLVAGTAMGDGPDKLVGVENVRGTRHSDRLTGSSRSNALRGRGGADKLSGRAGFDVLFGGRGRDVLTGLVGRDRLRGGAGRDSYRR